MSKPTWTTALAGCSSTSAFLFSGIVILEVERFL